MLWDEIHDKTSKEFQKALDDNKAKGFRPESVAAYPTPDGIRFAAIFVKDGKRYSVQFGLSNEEYLAEFERGKMAGFHPVSVVGYADSTPPSDEVYSKAMGKFMVDRRIPVGTFAVSRGGKLLHCGGLTLPFAQGMRAIQADDPLRIGGVTKAITAAAIHTLVREGKLTLDAKAFPLLGLKPPPGQKMDPRLNDITVRHLLEHKGGWDLKQTFDPLLRPLEIAADLKEPAPAGPVDIIRYMMGQPLQFDPGSRVCLSNFGYCVLGRVIEKVSGETYLAYIRKHIFAPLDGKSVVLARSLPKHRHPREPSYLDPEKGRNVLDPRSKEEVPAPDGGFYLEAMDAASGLIASSPDLVRFLDAYGISGERREGAVRPFVLFGNRSGTCSMLMQRPNGVNVAALFNQEKDPSGLDYVKIRDALQEIADRESRREMRYAAVWLKNE